MSLDISIKCRNCANFPCIRKECDLENKSCCEAYKSLIKKVSEEIDNER